MIVIIEYHYGGKKKKKNGQEKINIASIGNPQFFSRFDRSSGFKLDVEAFGTIEDDVSLESEIRFLDAGFHAVVSQDGREKDLELEHGVFAAYARTRSSGERHERVVMTAGRFLGQEVVRVKDIRVRVDVRLTVHLERSNYDGASSWYGIVTGSCVITKY